MPDSTPMPDAASVDGLHASWASALWDSRFYRKRSPQFFPLLKIIRVKAEHLCDKSLKREDSIVLSVPFATAYVYNRIVG